MQDIDGLKPSSYLMETARLNIEGGITIKEAKSRINGYYEARPACRRDDRTEEADKVSVRIAEILSERSFTFSPAQYVMIHGRLFEGIYHFAGKIRDYDISKAEWVLNGDTVYYASADSISATLSYDFEQERKFDYRAVGTPQAVQHMASFASRLWQIHAFGEGNTRTTAVFMIKYLRTFGFDVDNDMFAQHSWYFRNALVRSNYNDLKNDVHSTDEYLQMFFENLLLGGGHVLRNRDMHIGGGSEKGV
ncbi:MAG: Fic family protein [Methanomassiliicoccaceae archaeon]|nr:Fic family protein [Methanomassiliicoccaceae archaeon]